jgi:hypothetical protein
MIRTGLLALVFFCLLRAVAKKWGSDIPGLQAVIGAAGVGGS